MFSETLFSSFYAVQLEEQALNRPFKTYIVSLMCSLVLMVALTLLDVLVVHFLLIKKGLLVALPFFWWFPFGVMQLTFPLCLLLIFENRVPLTCYLFFVLGGEDTLYYLLAAGHVPEIYHGIYFLGFIFSPPRELVAKTLFLSVFLAVFLCYAEYKRLKMI